MPDVQVECFIWDAHKDRLNIERHGIGFFEASHVFEDPLRIIANDLPHSGIEERFYCIGKVGDSIITVRYTMRGDLTRIIGAGRWRKGRKFYEEKTRS